MSQRLPATKGDCVLCGVRIEGYGHNARPLADGVCCDTCNDDVVAARFTELQKIIIMEE